MRQLSLLAPAALLAASWTVPSSAQVDPLDDDLLFCAAAGEILATAALAVYDEQGGPTDLLFIALEGHNMSVRATWVVGNETACSVPPEHFFDMRNETMREMVSRLNREFPNRSDIMDAIGAVRELVQGCPERIGLHRINATPAPSSGTDALGLPCDWDQYED